MAPNNRDRAHADDESLEVFADYVNDRNGNFGAHVADRDIHGGNDAVEVDVGSTGSVSKVISIGTTAGFEVYDVEVRDNGLQTVVFVPAAVAEWLREGDAAVAEQHFDG